MYFLYDMPPEAFYFLGTITLLLGALGSAFFVAAARYFHLKRHVSNLIKWLSYLSVTIGALFFNVALFGVSGKIGWRYVIDDIAYATRPVILFLIIYCSLMVVYEIFKAHDEE